MARANRLVEKERGREDFYYLQVEMHGMRTHRVLRPTINLRMRALNSWNVGNGVMIVWVTKEVG